MFSLPRMGFKILIATLQAVDLYGELEGRESANDSTETNLLVGNVWKRTYTELSATALPLARDFM